MFAEDADFVVITGKYLEGRNEIVTYHARLLQTTSKAVTWMSHLSEFGFSVLTSRWHGWRPKELRMEAKK